MFGRSDEGVIKLDGRVYILDNSEAAALSCDFHLSGRWQFQREVLSCLAKVALQQQLADADPGTPPRHGYAVVSAGGRPAVLVPPTSDALHLYSRLADVPCQGELQLVTALKLALLTCRSMGRARVLSFVASSGGASALLGVDEADRLAASYNAAGVALDLVLLASDDEVSSRQLAALDQLVRALNQGDRPTATAGGASASASAACSPASSSACNNGIIVDGLQQSPAASPDCVPSAPDCDSPSSSSNNSGSGSYNNNSSGSADDAATPQAMRSLSRLSNSSAATPASSSAGGAGRLRGRLPTAAAAAAAAVNPPARPPAAPSRLIFLSPSPDPSTPLWQQIEPLLEELEMDTAGLGEPDDDVLLLAAGRAGGPENDTVEDYDFAVRGPRAAAGAGSPATLSSTASRNGRMPTTSSASAAAAAAAARRAAAPRGPPLAPPLVKLSRSATPGNCRFESLDSLQHLSSDGFLRSWLPSYSNIAKVVMAATASPSGSANGPPGSSSSSSSSSTSAAAGSASSSSLAAASSAISKAGRYCFISVYRVEPPKYVPLLTCTAGRMGPLPPSAPVAAEASSSGPRAAASSAADAAKQPPSQDARPDKDGLCDSPRTPAARSGVKLSADTRRGTLTLYHSTEDHGRLVLTWRASPQQGPGAVEYASIFGDEGDTSGAEVEGAEVSLRLSPTRSAFSAVPGTSGRVLRLALDVHAQRQTPAATPVPPAPAPAAASPGGGRGGASSDAGCPPISPPPVASTGNGAPDTQSANVYFFWLQQAWAGPEGSGAEALAAKLQALLEDPPEYDARSAARQQQQQQQARTGADGQPLPAPRMRRTPIQIGPLPLSLVEEFMRATGRELRPDGSVVASVPLVHRPMAGRSAGSTAARESASSLAAAASTLAAVAAAARRQLSVAESSGSWDDDDSEPGPTVGRTPGGRVISVTLGGGALSHARSRVCSRRNGASVEYASSDAHNPSGPRGSGRISISNSSTPRIPQLPGKLPGSAYHSRPLPSAALADDNSGSNRTTGVGGGHLRPAPGYAAAGCSVPLSASSPASAALRTATGSGGSSAGDTPPGTPPRDSSCAASSLCGGGSDFELPEGSASGPPLAGLGLLQPHTPAQQAEEAADVAAPYKATSPRQQVSAAASPMMATAAAVATAAAANAAAPNATALTGGDDSLLFELD